MPPCARCIETFSFSSNRRFLDATGQCHPALCCRPVSRRVRQSLGGARPHRGTSLIRRRTALQPRRRPTGVTRNQGHVPPLARSYAPKHKPTVGSYGGVCSYSRVTPVCLWPYTGPRESVAHHERDSFVYSLLTLTQPQGGHIREFPLKFIYKQQPRCQGRPASNLG